MNGIIKSEVKTSEANIERIMEMLSNLPDDALVKIQYVAEGIKLMADAIDRKVG